MGLSGSPQEAQFLYVNYDRRDKHPVVYVSLDPEAPKDWATHIRVIPTGGVIDVEEFHYLGTFIDQTGLYNQFPYVGHVWIGDRIPTEKI